MLFSSKVKEWIAGITKINIQTLICLLIQNSLHLYRSKNRYLPLFANWTHPGWMWVAAATDAMCAPTEGVYCAHCAESTLDKSTNISTHQQNVHMVLYEEFTLGQSFSTHQQNVHTAHCAEFTRGKDFQLTKLVLPTHQQNVHTVQSSHWRKTTTHQQIRMISMWYFHTGEKLIKLVPKKFCQEVLPRPNILLNRKCSWRTALRNNNRWL